MKKRICIIAAALSALSLVTIAIVKIRNRRAIYR
jgi:hypothetical protein